MSSPIVKRYLIAFDQHKWKGVAACIMILGGACFVSIQPPPPNKYEATGAVTYTQPPVIFSKTGTDIQQQAQTMSVDLFVNEDVIKKAAEKAKVNPKQVAKGVIVKLPKPPAKGETPPPPILTILFTDENDKKAAQVVNTVMEGMIERSRLINGSRLTAIKDEIKKRLPQAEKELRVSETALQDYTKREGPVLLAAENGSLIKGITTTQDQQRQVDFQLQGINQQIISLQQRLGLNPDQAYASSALSADPIIANLRIQIYQTESQLEILKKDLRLEHPNIVALVKQKQAYEQLLRQRASEVIGGNGLAAPLQNADQVRQDSNLDPARQMLAQQLVSLQTQKEALESQIRSLKNTEMQLRQEYRTIPDKQLGLARLQEQFQLKQGLHSKMLATLVDAQAAEAEIVSSLTIIKPAQVSALPETSQSPVVTILIGAVAGVAVGGGLIFLLGSMGGILQTMEDIRGLVEQQDVPLLGTIPLVLNIYTEQDGLPILVSSDSPYLESYERFRTNLRRASEKPLKVVLFTSTINQEGKSINAYNLGIASARAGKRTLVIEADLRSPSLAKSLKIASDPDASIEPLRYYGSWSECVLLVPEVENLYLVPSPGPLRQPAAVLESSEFRRLIEDMRGRFDLVIIDTPALSHCNDALLLEPLTDGMVLVARPGYTGESMLTEAIEQLTESEDTQLLGVLINGADIPPPMPTITKEVKEVIPQPETFEEEPLEKSQQGLGARG